MVWQCGTIFRHVVLVHFNSDRLIAFRYADSETGTQKELTITGASGLQSRDQSLPSVLDDAQASQRIALREVQAAISFPQVNRSARAYALPGALDPITDRAVH